MPDSRILSARVEICAITHKGLVRPNNEDCIAVGEWKNNEDMETPTAITHELQTPVCAVVCDGLGGHAGGEIASAMAARLLVAPLSQIADNALVASILRGANRRIFEAAEQDKGLSGMGTTAAGVQFSSAGALWFNVGDSKVFRYRNGFLRQLSADDVGPTGMLKQSLGGLPSFQEVEPHIGLDPLVSGWQYLVCSDGLTTVADHTAIEDAMSADWPASVNRLLELAISRGGPDNISIVVAKVET